MTRYYIFYLDLLTAEILSPVLHAANLMKYNWLTG